MYQTTIRNKKKSTNIVKNYAIDSEFEEYALSKKLLGNCRVSLITNSGNEVIGIIRGNMRKFNKRVLIEEGDIVVVSKRDFQSNKVDIVHKYNLEQTQYLINNKELSDVLINEYYKNSHKTDKSDNNDDTHIIFDNKEDEKKIKTTDNNTYQVHISDSYDTDNTDDDNIDDI
jgi:translation initiation factor 1A